MGESEEQYEQLQLPSLSAAWFLEEQQGSSPEVGPQEGCGSCLPACLPATHMPSWPSPTLSLWTQVAAVSRRILALQQLLGGGGEGGVDVVWMVVREPRLLSADFRRCACLLPTLRAVLAGTRTMWGLLACLSCLFVVRLLLFLSSSVNC